MRKNFSNQDAKSKTSKGKERHKDLTKFGSFIFLNTVLKFKIKINYKQGKYFVNCNSQRVAIPKI